MENDRQSGPPVIFQESARQLLERLTAATGESYELRKEVEAIIEVLERWKESPPPRSERVEVIQRLLSAHRRVMEFFVKK